MSRWQMSRLRTATAKQAEIGRKERYNLRVLYLRLVSRGRLVRSAEQRTLFYRKGAGGLCILPITSEPNRELRLSSHLCSIDISPGY